MKSKSKRLLSTMLAFAAGPEPTNRYEDER